jgi:hypothetical protein
MGADHIMRGGFTSSRMSVVGYWAVRSRLLVLLLVCVPCVAAAQPAAVPDTQDGQTWVQALAIGQISEHWRAHLELQPRIFDNTSELGLTIARTAVGRRLAPGLTAWIGHAWVPRTLGSTTRHEQRLWQQLSVTLPQARRWAPSARIRLEQRWLEPWAGASHRLRLLTRLQRPLGASTPWSVAFYDEAMVTLDNTPLGPARGFDRNRLYGGLVHRLSTAISAEVGYVWEHSTLPGPPQRNDHVALGVINLAFARR